MTIKIDLGFYFKFQPSKLFSEMDRPLFSIIVPSFNHANFLKDCICSIIAQTSETWQMILVNDGSIDNTEAVVKEFSEYDRRLCYIYQENQGLSMARNAGLKEAKGEYLLFLDADDWLEPNCLELFSSIVRGRPEFELFRCGYSYYDQPRGNLFHTHIPSKSGEIWPAVLVENIGPCHSILIKRSFAEILGGFDPSLKSCEDWDYWIRAGKMGAEIYSVSEVLVTYRYVANSMSRNAYTMYEALNEVSRRAGLHDMRLPEEALYNQTTQLEYPELRKRHLIRMIGVLLHQGRLGNAVEFFQTENINWNWKFRSSDWRYLSSNLSWGYFLRLTDIRQVLADTKPTLEKFFLEIGFTNRKSSRIARMVFAPQLKKRNHLKFGRYFGSILNKLSIY